MTERVVFVNRFYWPEEPATAQLLTDLAEALASEGCAVEVVTSRPAGTNTPARELRNGVRVHRIASPRLRKFGVLGRALAWFAFHPGAWWKLVRLLRHDDVVVALTDPPMLGVTTWLATKVRGARLVHWIQDIYPEIAMTLVRTPGLGSLKRVRDAAWRGSEHCVVPGVDMARALIEANLPPHQISVCPNWAPKGLQSTGPSAVSALRREWLLEGKFILGYSGNLGRVHDLKPLLNLAEHLRDDPDFVLLFIGEGAQRENLEIEARARSLTNVVFRPAQPRSQLSVALSVSHVHAVTLIEGAEAFVFPSKLYGIAAVGRPVLFIGARSSELADTIERRRLGQSFSRTETLAMASWLRELRSNESRRAEHEHAALSFASGGFAAARRHWSALLGTLLRTPAGQITDPVP
jgi:glycosyltransferase involved in cell wall biosynthesis